MNEVPKDILQLVSNAFSDAAGPAAYRHKESGFFYETEGYEIAKALLNLHPEDIQHDEIIDPISGTFMPGWCTNEGLLWLIPGIVRVIFEDDPQSGDCVLESLIAEIHFRVSNKELILDRNQMVALLELHEAFYCSEEFGWRPDLYNDPLCDWIHKELLKY